MTKRRSLFGPGYSVSTRGHSILRRGTYGYSPRAGVVDSFVPEYVPRKLGYETSSEEYSIGGAVTHATLNSDAFLYDNFDTASKSRGRDQQLLADATAAIPPSTHSSLMATSRRTTAALPGRRFLSHTRAFSPDLDDTPPKKSGLSLSTSHLQASAPPRPNITPSVLKYSRTPGVPSTATKIASFKSKYGGAPAETSTRLLGGYIPKSLYRAGSPYPSGSASPLYNSSYKSLQGRARRSSFDSGMGSPLYSPTSYSHSTKLLGGYVSPRFAYRTASSPYRSGTQSPVLPSYTTRPRQSVLGGYIAKSLSPSSSPLASGAQTPVTYTSGRPLNTYDTYYVNASDGYADDTYRTRRRPRVLGTKAKVGNYYERLLRKRSGKKGSSKYWPYIDVEDINSEAGDVLSDTESIPDRYGDYATHWDEEGGAVGGSYSDTYDTYDDYGDSYRDSYMDEPDEYVPFKPRRRLESPGVFELSPYEDTPSIPDLPLVSKLQTVPSVISDISKSSKANDLYLNSLVSSTSSRALTTFKNNGWRDYDNASLVLSVEGDVVSPDTGGRYGFKYYHPPVPIVGRGLGDNVFKLPSSAVDSFFGTYVNRLQDIRSSVRDSLENKTPTSSTPYRPAGAHSPSSYREIGTFTSPKRDSYSGTQDSYLPYTSFRKRLQGGATQRVDVIELPVSERVLPSETLSLTLPGASLAHDKDKAEPYKLTVLDKIKIKAAIVASTVEVEPRRKRPRSKFAADKLRATRAPASEEAVQPTVTTGLHASRPPLRTSLWRYRMESRVDPVDIMYKPGSFNRMRDQVRGAHDKLDRHRQLLDRYLVEGHPSSDISARVLRKTEELEQRNPSSK